MATLSGEQRLLVDSTRRYLSASGSTSGTVPGSTSATEWTRGADLGWCALLADPGRADRFADLVLIAREFGRAVGAGPLGPVNVVVAALRQHDPAHPALPGLVDGTVTAAWVDGRSRWPGTGPGVEARRDSERAEGFVLDGQVSPVEAAAGSANLLVTCHDATTLLVPTATTGVTVSELHSLDPGRRYATVRIEGVHVDAGALIGAAGGADLADELLDLAVLVQLAEMVGAMEWALETTTRWCADRYSFGRPLAAYQAIQHRVADMAMWLEAGRAITSDLAQAFTANGAAGRSELASAGKAYLGRYGTELLQECVQLHGGIGVTAEHDLHRYLRRVSVAASTHGSAREHARRVGRAVEARVTS